MGLFSLTAVSISLDPVSLSRNFSPFESFPERYHKSDESSGPGPCSPPVYPFTVIPLTDPSFRSGSVISYREERTDPWYFSMTFLEGDPSSRRNSRKSRSSSPTVLSFQSRKNTSIPAAQSQIQNQPGIPFPQIIRRPPLL